MPVLSGLRLKTHSFKKSLTSLLLIGIKPIAFSLKKLPLYEVLFQTMRKLFFIFLIGILISSCARVGSPNGGKKDTLAPKFLGANIDTSRVRVSTSLKELRLNFDEYVMLKDINKNLIISPPIKKIKKIIPSNLANKYILIQWEDELQPNTTYNFNFGNSIVDYNEGNILPYHQFVFSTGEKLDNLYISGTVTDGLSANIKAKNEKTKNLVVGLYKEDQTDFRQKPYYITKVDDDGYFELNFLSPGKYRLIAFEDENMNSIFDSGKEKVGFVKDKIDLSKSISNKNIRLYPSKKALKYIEMKPINGGLVMLFEGQPNKVEIQSVSEELKEYKITHRTQSDSAFVWFDAQRSNIGIQSPTRLELSYNADGKKDTVSISYRANTKEEFSLSNTKGNLLNPKKPFIISASRPIQNIKAEQFKLISDSIAQNFTAKISENHWEIQVKGDFKEGKKYSFSIPKESVSSFYESNAKAYRFDFEVDKAENYGTLTLKIKNPPVEPYWIELLNDKGEVEHTEKPDSPTVKLTMLKPATYFARILVDNNKNGIWDLSDFSSLQSAEDVYLFEKEIQVRPMWEIVEEWDLKK